MQLAPRTGYDSGNGSGKHCEYLCPHQCFTAVTTTVTLALLFPLRPDRDRFRRPYLYPFGDSESPTELTIKQRPFGPEGFASTVWDSAIVLSKYFERLGSSVLSGKRVIELGAGCGLVTVVAARLGADCTATDMEPNLPLLDENCTLNGAPPEAASCAIPMRNVRLSTCTFTGSCLLNPAARAAKGGPCPRLLPLSWGRAETEAFVAATHGSADSSRAGGGGGGYDVVVGTDLMYIDGAVGALVETLDVRRAAQRTSPSSHSRVLSAASVMRSSAFTRQLRFWNHLIPPPVASSRFPLRFPAGCRSSAPMAAARWCISPTAATAGPRGPSWSARGGFSGWRKYPEAN